MIEKFFLSSAVSKSVSWRSSNRNGLVVSGLSYRATRHLHQQIPAVTQLRLWILVGQTAGYFFNPSGSPNQFGLVQSVPSVLAAIGGNSLLVVGNAGLAISQGITQSTTNGQNSDDYVAMQVLDGAAFIKGPVVIGYCGTAFPLTAPPEGSKLRR
jgi:hypothetical protein